MATSIDARASNLDRTVRVFDAFYNLDLVVSANEYDIVYAYFRSISASTTIAKNFTTFVFRIATALDKPVLEILDGVKGNSAAETNAVIAYYLNSFKSKTSLYGVSVVPTPNESVQRNVVI